MRGGGRAAPAAWALGTALGLAAAGVHGQPGARVPALEGLGPLGEVPVLATPAVVRSASASVDDPAGGPAPFAEPFAVAVTPARRGVWEVTSDGRFAVWRLRVTSPGAVSLNFGFTRYRMPPGGSLRIRAAEGGESIGPFTDADNEAHGQLWTPVVPGGDAVIEVAVPVGRAEELELELTAVNRGFRDLFPEVVRTPAHGSCHIDVACPEADPYRDQVRSVGFMSLSGRDWCSGFLINNTARDRKPYFMTAAHCMWQEWAPTVVVYWNHESPTCGARSGGSRAQYQSGATLVARSRETDFALLLLDDEVDPDHDLFFAGWSVEPAPPSSAFMIHHPRSHVKSINLTSQPLTVTGYFKTDPSGGNHLRIPSWDRGAAEPGSSGSPLFGPDKRVVGVHRGGGSECGNKLADWSGRLASSWLGRGVPKGRLIDWLDPLGTGEMAIDGMPWNYPPEAAGTLHDKSLRLADGALEVDVAHGFHDRDGDALVYTATSSDETVATAALSGSTVTVSPVAAGAVTVTVTASDGKADPVSRTFPVTVGANRSPEPVGTLAALSLRVKAGAAGASSVDVSAAFEDDDGDTLTYGASSSDESVATVSVSGSTVSVTPVSGGRAVIAVTATDAGGSNTSARQGFEATVANRPPAAASALAALTLRMGEGAATVDATAGFLDPDGDVLRYSATSSDESVAAVTMRWGNLTVRPVSLGSATITVTATDPAGSNESASATFDVAVHRARGVTVTPPGVTLQEGGAAAYTVVLDTVPTGAVTVTPSVPPNTDVSVDPLRIEFGVSDWDMARTINVRAASDADALTDAAVTITHAASGADYGSVAVPSVTVSILETDMPVLSVGAASGPESGALAFEVVQSVPSSSVVTVDYATSNGTARAGSDYVAASGTLTFPAGSTASRQVVVNVLDDTVDEEEEETFVLTLRNATNASLAGGGSTLAATGTIRDDDDPSVAVSFGASRYNVTEGRSAGVAVRLDRDPERHVEVFLEWTHLGGATPADYWGLPASVSFSSGQTRRTFEVGATDDEENDDGESVVLRFATPLPDRVAARGGTTIAIADNDGGGPPTGGPPTGGPGGPGGPPPPPDDEEEDDEDDGDDGGPPSGGPPPGSGGGGPPRAAMETDAECEAGLCRARTGERVSFEDASAGSVRSRHWDFGDGGRSRSASPSHAWASPGFHEVALVVSDGSVESTASLMFLVEAAGPAGTCAADEWTRCLGDSRYAVTVEWRSADGETGRGRVAPAGTNESAMFRFFDASNWEVLVKVLDGCEANGHAWVFGASTTDLGYVIRVTDTATGAGKEYRNEPGTAASAITDVKAFPEGCR